jgi:site-specific DNA-methyltransferase (adenine-specific)
MIKINLVKKELLNGDCLEVMRSLPDNSIDSIVTDPPYGISFMGKKWDYDVPSKEVFAEMLRVLKPGGHALIACGTRTQHRMAVNIEDAGFEIRDVITWLYGSGFPKSMDISKAIDKQAGVKGETYIDEEFMRRNPGKKLDGIDRKKEYSGTEFKEGIEGATRFKPATDAAKQWQGWGTALKPACEFWTLARKPLSEKTVASNVLEHGTGGINIDGCRIGSETIKTNGGDKFKGDVFGKYNTCEESFHTGRWPANLILDEEAAMALDEQSGERKSAGKYKDIDREYTETAIFNSKINVPPSNKYAGETGGASRFFYVAKASKSERDAGCEGLPSKVIGTWGGEEDDLTEGKKSTIPRQNFHPTVKPIKLMTYLCKLITPPNGIVLDPFMGSGSTGVAAVKEGFGFIGIEREPAYYEICKARIESAS